MKSLLKVSSLLLMFVSIEPALARNGEDEAKIRAIAANWQTAWNEHDMQALARLFTEDADFVNVGAKHWKGRKEIEEQHSARLGQFLESVFATKEVTVQFLKPDIALVHVEWSLAGDKDPDGTPRKPREGLFTWILVRQADGWLIRAAQNTNLSSVPPPATPK